MDKFKPGTGEPAPSLDELTGLLKEARAIFRWYQSSATPEIKDICEKIDAALARTP